MSAAKLMKVTYYDDKAQIGLECYSDTVVIESCEKINYIAAVRLGGYPESVKGMADAIFGGGAVDFEIDGKIQRLVGRVKQYYREYSHDGLYAEAVLRIRDEEQRQASTAEASNSNKENATDTGNEQQAAAPRKCYIFCGSGNDEQLFEEVDKKTAVPLIPEFKDYVLSELRERRILKPLQIISIHEKFDAWVLHMVAEEKNIIDTINDGLNCGDISISEAAVTGFPEVHSVTQYLNTFGVQIAERIKGQFSPLFDPAAEALSPEVLAVNDFIKANAGYSLYDAQLAVVESHKRCLERGKVTLCIAECGSGKSKIGTSALHAYQQRLNFRQSDSAQHTKHFNIVLCPSHMAKKWVREIEEALPDTFAVIVTSISELKKVYKAYERDTLSCYVIITKEKARDGYMRRPAVKWNKRRRAFICPDCYAAIKMEIIDCGDNRRVNADPFFFRRESKKNHKCEACGSLLWTALLPEQQSEWVKVSEYGFVYRQMAYMYLDHARKKPRVYDELLAIADNPDSHFPSAGAYRRVALSTYIKSKMKGKIDGLVVDELHNYNNNSGQGDAMGELLQTAKKVVGMTATLINGYSSGIFHLLYRISPRLMLLDNKSYEKPLDFNTEYGVTESVYEIDAPDYNANRRTTKRKMRERQLPGVSPLVYSRFLMESAAFLSLNDMGKSLPEYEEIPIQLEMNTAVRKEYNRIEGEFKRILKSEKELAAKILSTYLNLLTVYPDQPYGHEPVKCPKTGYEIIEPEDTSSIEELHEKDEHVLDLVRSKSEKGERVLIYTSWVRIDTQEKLTRLLTDEGYRVAVLTAAVSPQKREEWVDKQVQSGIDVVITNPSLVETGLDLNDFTTIIFYNISYKLFTLRQASRRSWRINQRAPRIEVYFFYYENTLQHRAIRLMASKLAVAGVIEGNLTDEGLAAMSECEDMTTALARELSNGIEGEIEDLDAVFKKMAILKPVAEAPQGVDVIEGNAAVIDSTVDGATALFDTDIGAATVATQAPIANRPKQASGLLGLLSTPKTKRTQKKKASFILENQMTLFDLTESIA
ncbi:MAG: hypothetical protein FWG87_01530 [Defluviitaleaceae bacterium]|nr:hypothetical protein [Defluviitaleaceae bacterium]